ncbi:MAG: hypothetical protein ACOY82_01490 [Pseudomonadota bacterium]
MDDEQRLTEAMRETLLHVAGVSGAIAKRLRPGQALVADLGLEDVDLEVLAGCQRKLGDRLRRDHGTTRIDADALYDLTVGDVFALTVRRALGRELNAAEGAALFARAQAGLRGAAG